MIRHLLAYSIVAFATVTLAADWPQFRGPNGSGVATDASVPAVLDAKSIAWTADLPGRGLSSPIVVGDRVFITCASGPQQERLHVFCFNAADGSRRWERQFWATGRTMTQTKTCVAAPTPVSDGKRLFALFSSNDLFCLDLDGNLLWLRGLTRDYPNASNSIGLASSPTVAGDVLIVQIENDADSFAAGLDVATGVNRWRQDRPKTANWTSPVLFTDKAGRQNIAFMTKKGVTAYNPATGNVLWNFDEISATIPSATAADGILYVPSKGLVALAPQANDSTPKTVWHNNQLNTGTCSPLVVGDHVFTMNGAGILSCGETSTGKRLWQLRLKGPFSGTPVSAAGKVYLVNEKGLLQVVDATKSPGELVSELDLAQTILCTPAIANNAVYVRSDGKLWKIGKK